MESSEPLYDEPTSVEGCCDLLQEQCELIAVLIDDLEAAGQLEALKALLAALAPLTTEGWRDQHTH